MGWIIPNSHGSAHGLHLSSVASKARQRIAEAAPASQSSKSSGSELHKDTARSRDKHWKRGRFGMEVENDDENHGILPMGWSYAVSNFEIKLYKMGIFPMISSMIFLIL